MIFNFAVRRLHFLAHVPLAPQIFNALLLAWNWLSHRERIMAIEWLESRAREIPGVRLCNHRFGGTGFERDGREFAHVHGNGLVDVHLTREQADKLVGAGAAEPHHVLGRSTWVSFWLRSEADAPRALELLKLGADTASQGRS